MEEKKKVYGIDLGTTYSCIATIDEYGKAVVLKNSDSGASTTPSVVYYNSANDVTVGEVAKESLGVEPRRTVSLIKRQLGNPNFQSRCEFPESPTEVSSRILEKLVSYANASLDEEIKDVVITCPAYFGTEERMQTKQAGIIAGLNVLEIINEPTAAAIAYGSSKANDKVILVYDLGGGTFDITMIEVKPDQIDVIATGGNAQLGGADWDVKLAQYLAQEFGKETGLTDLYDNLNNYIQNEDLAESDMESINALLLSAEIAKKRLTNIGESRQTIQFEGVSQQVSVTRDKFEEITSGLLNETLELIETMMQVAAKKGYSKDRIDEVILVGGSSKMLQVKRAVERMLGRDAKITDPDECVAKGAAIRADELANATLSSQDRANTKNGPKTIRNVLSKTYGTDSSGGVTNLVFRNTTVPCQGEDSFVTQSDGQSVVTIYVYESEKDDKHISLGEARPLSEERLLEFGKPVPKGTSLRVVYDINEEGILNILAYNDSENVQLKFDLKLDNVFSDDELQELIVKHSTSKVQ